MAGTSEPTHAGLASEHEEGSRRDFLTILTVAAGAIGAAAVVWPFIDALGPDADRSAAAHPIIDVAGIPENTGITVMWAGQPIYIRRLTKAQIANSQNVVPDSLPDPARYIDRTKPGYGDLVVVVGLNTAAPCLLLGNDPSEPRGPLDGWISPCDGSVYDPLGRVRGGPANRNLTIPPFTFLDNAQIQLG
ncbi:ubiquinol-cytochrome c reductase iron-sulfur subunit [Acidocella sp.]|jgi:ubiquinol-cytochrome c reductase iron-sulfur subunit|uniref:ubiquinol-cytochrome c reductase iron-sulfur subunit n=1 Tax=Acidocella sp. TaxID=50710 RepID=UPI002F3E7ED0